VNDTSSEPVDWVWRLRCIDRSKAVDLSFQPTRPDMSCNLIAVHDSGNPHGAVEMQRNLRKSSLIVMGGLCSGMMMIPFCTRLATDRYPRPTIPDRSPVSSECKAVRMTWKTSGDYTVGLRSIDIAEHAPGLHATRVSATYRTNVA
jgi:hypothetical protein